MYCNNFYKILQNTANPRSAQAFQISQLSVGLRPKKCQNLELGIHLTIRVKSLNRFLQNMTRRSKP